MIKTNTGNFYKNHQLKICSLFLTGLKSEVEAGLYNWRKFSEEFSGRAKQRLDDYANVGRAKLIPYQEVEEKLNNLERKSFEIR